jgi:hypothetical protein
MTDITVPHILTSNHQLQLLGVITAKSYIYYAHDLHLRMVLTTWNSKQVGYEYCDGAWFCVKYLTNHEIIPPTITEKMGIMFALIVRQTQNIALSDIETFHSAQYCTITKLMLLREITAQYLIHDLLPILFDKTE